MATAPPRAVPRVTRRLPRAERREVILRSAAQLFGRRGYAAASMEDIAAAAGVTKLILYRHFASKADLYRAVLQRVADQLKQTNYQIVVTGHTDNKPIGKGLVNRYPTNWELAGARAASVVRLFVDSGLPAGRLLAASMGETRPVAPNDTPDGRTKNRRIEIRLRPVVVDEPGPA